MLSFKKYQMMKTLQNFIDGVFNKYKEILLRDFGDEIKPVIDLTAQDMSIPVLVQRAIGEYVSYREQQVSAKAFEEGMDNIVKNLNSEFERLQQSSESLKDILYLDGVLAVINTREIVNPYKTDNNENA